MVEEVGFTGLHGKCIREFGWHGVSVDDRQI